MEINVVTQSQLCVEQRSPCQSIPSISMIFWDTTGDIDEILRKNSFLLGQQISIFLFYGMLGNNDE